MKLLPLVFFLLFVSLAYASVSLDDIVKLSETKTSDEVILQLIEKEGLARPVTSKDIVYLKEHGVSDRVVQYLVKLSSTQKPVEAEKNLRSYYTTTKSGKRIRVVTNLDENGKRIGGEVPPDSASPEPAISAYEPPPQEIRVVVESASRRDPNERDYPYEEEYVDDRYVMPEWPSYYYPYSTPFYPYAPYYPLYPNGRHHKKGHHQGDPGQPHWNYDYSKRGPLTRPQVQRQQPRASRPAHAGTSRSMRIR